MAEPYLDLMAFARGAEFANDRNWADTFRDIQSRAQENALQRGQQVFDMNKPVAEAKVQDFMRGRDAGLNAARFSADVLREATAQPAEAQGGYLAARLYGQLQKAQSPEEASAIYNFGKAQMAAALNRGDQAGALAIANAMPGQNMTEALKGHLNWGNPKFYTDPANVEAAGGKLQPDGSVLYGGTKIPLALFANIQRRMATNQTFDQTAVLAPHAQRQQQLTATQDWMQQFNPQYAQQGVQFVLGPNGQMMAIPVAPPAPVPMQQVPDMATPGATGLPTGVVPSQAGYGRGFVNPPLAGMPITAAPFVVAQPPAPAPQQAVQSPGQVGMAGIQADAVRARARIAEEQARLAALNRAQLALTPPRRGGTTREMGWMTQPNF